MTGNSAPITLRVPIIALISGSSRTGSLNSKLLDHAGSLLRRRGATVRHVKLSDYELPVFDQDVEKASFPKGAKRLRAELKEADAFLVASPEYNGFPTPALVNAITWATRGEGGMYDAFQGKVGVVIAASPGALGGMRGLNPTRELLQNCGVNCLAASVAVGRAYTAFAENGSLSDQKQEAQLDAAVAQLHHFARAEANRGAQCKIMKEVKRLGTMGQNGEISLPGELSVLGDKRTVGDAHL